MNLHKEIFVMFAAKGIFLPKEEIIEVEAKIRASASQSILSALYQIQEDEKYKVFTDPEKGAWQLSKNKIRALALDDSKSIIQIDKYTNQTIAEHHSIYAAAQAIGKGKDECGNISQAANGKRKSAFGFIWRFK